MNKKESLQKLPIFSDLKNDEIDIIEKYLSIKTYKKEDLITCNKNEDQRLFIVLKGKITNSINLPESIEQKIIEYNEGDFFGEMLFFGYQPMFDTFQAYEKSEIISLGKKNINALIEKNSVIAIKIITRLISMTVQKLGKSSKFLTYVVQWGENASRRVITDELTGLYNRTFLDDAIENFFYISKSNNKPLSLFMLDLDNFRKINEDFGIETGNIILKELVNLIKNITEKHGIFARYGGDEYSILLPETDLNKAKAIAEQMRKAVEAYDFSKYLSGSKIDLTISIGISSFPDTANDIAAFKEKADSALYKAKESGKNRVEYIE